jgi:hypothetical protein
MEDLIPSLHRAAEMDMWDVTDRQTSQMHPLTSAAAHGGSVEQEESFQQMVLNSCAPQGKADMALYLAQSQLKTDHSPQVKPRTLKLLEGSGQV